MINVLFTFNVFISDLIKNAENQQHSLNHKPNGSDKFHYNKKYTKPAYKSSLSAPPVVTSQSTSRYIWAKANTHSNSTDKTLDRRQVKPPKAGGALPSKDDITIKKSLAPTVSHVIRGLEDYVVGAKEKQLRCGSNSNKSLIIVQGQSKESSRNEKEKYSVDSEKVNKVIKAVPTEHAASKWKSSSHVAPRTVQAVFPQTINKKADIPNVKKVVAVGKSAESHSLNNRDSFPQSETFPPHQTPHIRRKPTSSQCSNKRRKSASHDESFKDKRTLYDSALSFLSTALGDTVSFKDSHMMKFGNVHESNRTIGRSQSSAHKNKHPGTTIAKLSSNVNDVCGVSAELGKTAGQIQEVKSNISRLHGFEYSDQSVLYPLRISETAGVKEGSVVGENDISPKFKSSSPYKYVRTSSDADSVFEQESCESRYSPQTRRRFQNSRHKLQKQHSLISDFRGQNHIKSRYVLRKENVTNSKQICQNNSLHVNPKKNEHKIFSKGYHKCSGIKGGRSLTSRYVFVRDGNEESKQFSGGLTSGNAYQLTRSHSPSRSKNVSRTPVSRQQLKWTSKAQYSSKTSPYTTSSKTYTGTSPRVKGTIVKSRYKLQRVSVGETICNQNSYMQTAAKVIKTKYKLRKLTNAGSIQSYGEQKRSNSLSAIARYSEMHWQNGNRSTSYSNIRGRRVSYNQYSIKPSSTCNISRNLTWRNPKSEGNTCTL